MSQQQLYPTSSANNSPMDHTTGTDEQWNSALPYPMGETVHGSQMPLNQQFQSVGTENESLYPGWENQFQYGGLPSSPDTASNSDGGYFSTTNSTLPSLPSPHSNSFQTVSSPDLSMHTTSSPPPVSSPDSNSLQPMSPPDLNMQNQQVQADTDPSPTQNVFPAENYANWTFTNTMSSSAMYTPPVYQNWNAFNGSDVQNTVPYGNFMSMQQNDQFYSANGYPYNASTFSGDQLSTSYPHQFHAAPVKPHDPRLITITLSNKGIWKKIGAQVMEMMVTNDGRHINPRIFVSLGHLQDDCLYEIGMKLVLQSQSLFQVRRTREDGEVKEHWEQVTVKNKKEVEKETIEIFFGKKSGAEMQKDEQPLFVKIYNVGDEKKKGANAKSEMSEAARVEAEKLDKKRADTMFKVVSQHKYMPVVTLYQIHGFHQKHQVAQVSFPEAQFIASSGYKSKAMKMWKTENTASARKDYKNKITGK